MPVKVKRVYEPAEKSDGVRILVDRLWPRGIAKTGIDLWLKEVAPSNALRKWYGHEPEKWPAFRAKYKTELKRNAEPLRQLREAIKGKTVTLLYGARDETRNQAVVLAEFLQTRAAPAKARKP